jgi:hypothetical protein
MESHTDFVLLGAVVDANDNDEDVKADFAISTDERGVVAVEVEVDMVEDMSASGEVAKMD